MTPEDQINILKAVTRAEHIGLTIDNEGDLCISWEGDDEWEDDAARERALRESNERYSRRQNRACDAYLSWLLAIADDEGRDEIISDE